MGTRRYRFTLLLDPRTGGLAGIEWPQQEEKPVSQVISMDKKYTTRDGRAVRVLCVDAPDGQPVVALVKDHWEKRCSIQRYESDGGFFGNDGLYAGRLSEYDLVEVKPEHTVYANVYPFGLLSYPTREKADSGAALGRVACVKVTYKEGQFDE